MVLSKTEWDFGSGEVTIQALCQKLYNHVLFICFIPFYLVRTLVEGLYLQCFCPYLSSCAILQKIRAQDWCASYSLVFSVCAAVLLLSLRL